MSNNSPMYRKYGPQNEQIFKRVEEEVNQGQFAPAIIVKTLDVFIPTYYIPGIEDYIVKEEHFKGFKAALTLAMAAMWESIDNHAAANIMLMQSGTDEIRRNGSVYLARGKSIFMKDNTGKSLFIDVVNYIQAHFSNLDFVEGARVANTVYLAYLARLLE